MLGRHRGRGAPQARLYGSEQRCARRDDDGNDTEQDEGRQEAQAQRRRCASAQGAGARLTGAAGGLTGVSCCAPQRRARRRAFRQSRFQRPGKGTDRRLGRDRRPRSRRIGTDARCGGRVDQRATQWTADRRAHGFGCHHGRTSGRHGCGQEVGSQWQHPGHVFTFTHACSRFQSGQPEPGRDAESGAEDGSHGPPEQCHARHGSAAGSQRTAPP